jgi:hypothetical protein
MEGVDLETEHIKKALMGSDDEGTPLVLLGWLGWLLLLMLLLLQTNESRARYRSIEKH